MDCVDEVLTAYKNKHMIGSQKTKIKIGKMLIDLMDSLNDPDDYLRVKNCLILIINLFFEGKEPDPYNSTGKLISELSKKEEIEAKNILKSEFNQNDNNGVAPNYYI